MASESWLDRFLSIFGRSPDKPDRAPTESDSPAAAAASGGYSAAAAAAAAAADPGNAAAAAASDGYGAAAAAAADAEGAEHVLQQQVIEQEIENVDAARENVIQQVIEQKIENVEVGVPEPTATPPPVPASPVPPHAAPSSSSSVPGPRSDRRVGEPTADDPGTVPEGGEAAAGLAAAGSPSQSVADAIASLGSTDGIPDLTAGAAMPPEVLGPDPAEPDAMLDHTLLADLGPSPTDALPDDTDLDGTGV